MLKRLPMGKPIITGCLNFSPQNSSKFLHEKIPLQVHANKEGPINLSLPVKALWPAPLHSYVQGKYIDQF